MSSNGLLPAKCAIWHPHKHQHQHLDAGLASPSVLVVDDYIDTADAIGMILMLEGFSTEVAYCGRIAIEIAHRWRPDFVVLDICMPDLSGFEVATRLRNQESTAAVIIVGHSALGAERDFDQARAAGFNAYCAKPLDASKLAPLLRYLHRPVT